MYKTEEEIKLENEANKHCYMNRVIDNIKVKTQNGRLWSPYHDMQLYEYVIKYNFNFYEISNAFQRLCNNDKKYEYSEDAVRLHWAFLHAMRNFDQTPDDAYYQRMKLQYDKEKPKTFVNRVEEREKIVNNDENLEKNGKKEEKIEKIEGVGGVEKKEENNEKNEKDEEEIDEICTSSKREEPEKEDEKKKDIKENINSNNNNENKLYDDKNEPEFIKQLFSKKIPQEIIDKLNKDQGKYNNNLSPEKESNSIIKEISPHKIINENKINESNLDEKKDNIINDIKDENENIINTNINIDIEILKKEEIIIKDDNEEDLFPIKSNKQKEIQNKTEKINMEQELRNTQDFNDYIQNNPELKKSYDQLNNYCNFAVKSINYIVNKNAGVDTSSESEAKKIEQANTKLNEFLLEPIIKKTKEEGFTIEDWNKRIEEEEHKMNFETTNYDNYMKNQPKDEDREMKLNKFKEHLFGFAEKISTEELLEKITGIIGQSNTINNNSNQINNDNIQSNNLPNSIQNFMNNIENNNTIANEEEKSENTKEQSESVIENEGGGRNTISSLNSTEKKYRHVYRGIVYYSDKQNDSDKKKNNNIKKKKYNDDDDEIEEDNEDNEDDYNK